jgi:crotonobetainyl-CoA:carnitine CoA-transferase CaiB-like acyl-CoA transferase
MSGIVPAAIGNSHFVHVPYNSFPTSDGHVIVACIGDAFFERFAETMDLPELRKPEYLQQPVRYAAKEQIEAVIKAAMKTESSAFWLEKLRAARIPCGPVNNLEQALGDRQVQARDMVVEVTLASGNKVRMPGNPIKLSGEQAGFTRPPGLGEHTHAVLASLLGYSDDTISRLQRAGAVG